MAKKILLLLLLAAAALPCRADIPEVYAVLSPAVLVMPGTGYGALYGGRAGIKVISGRFLFSLSLGGEFGTGKPRSYETEGNTASYGLYKDEWFAFAQPESAQISYSAAFFSAGFGWNISNFFSRRQFICVEFGGRYEDERVGGKGFYRFGRYHSELYLHTEVAEFDDFRINFKAGFGGLSCETAGGPGFENYGVFAAEAEFDTLLFKITGSRKPAEEGGAVWE